MLILYICYIHKTCCAVVNYENNLYQYLPLVMLTLTARGSTLVVRRQILTSKVDPRTVRVKNIYNGRRPITQVFK